MNGFIPLCVPQMGDREGAYLQECVDGNWVSSAGAFVGRLESMVAEYVGADHGVAVVNGTCALHLALRVAGIGDGDEVVTSALSFVAPANAIRHAGAWPVFVDAEPSTWQMDVGLCLDFLHKGCERRGDGLFNKQSGRRVAAVMPVHILGGSVDMAELAGACRDLGLPLIEDASESLGAQQGGHRVGGLGDMACFSFNGNKLVTCGGGGLIATDRADWARRARHVSTQARSDDVEYEHDEVGHNYRLTNIQAAVGCAQFERIDALLAAKRRIADGYRALCERIPGLTFMPARDGDALWMSTVLVDEDAFGMGSRALLANLRADDIETRPLWVPLQNTEAHAGALVLGGAVADRLHREGLSLPSSAGLTPDDQDRVMAAIEKAGP